MQLTYSEKLKDPRWQKKRLMVLDAANWRCEDCSRGDKTLEIHHCAYNRRLEPWEYDLTLLMALCSDCHLVRQQKEDSIRVNLGQITRCFKINEVDAAVWELVDTIILKRNQKLAEAFS